MMKVLRAAYADKELGVDRPEPGELVMPDIPAGGPHNRFVSLQTDRRCMNAVLGAAEGPAVDGHISGFVKRYPGLPAKMLEDMLVDVLANIADLKYDGLFRVLVTETDATLIGVKDDDVVRQLWTGFNPARYL